MLHHRTPDPGSDRVNNDKVGLLAYPLCYAFPTSGQWLVCNRKKGLTAAGTAQVSHLIPIYQIVFAAAKVQKRDESTKKCSRKFLSPLTSYLLIMHYAL